jgi:hypothetical protein
MVDEPHLAPTPRLVVLPVAAQDDLVTLQELWPDARTEMVSSRVPSKSFYLIVRASR